MGLQNTRRLAVVLQKAGIFAVVLQNTRLLAVGLLNTGLLVAVLQNTEHLQLDYRIQNYFIRTSGYRTTRSRTTV